MSPKDDLDNHANQMNPNNDAYWESRGFDDRPDDWEDRADENDDQPALREGVLSQELTHLTLCVRTHWLMGTIGLLAASYLIEAWSRVTQERE